MAREVLNGDNLMDEQNALVFGSMHITKASLDRGVMRWAATNSDTDPDLYDERMSLELYKDFIARIENEEELPEEFKSAACSDYWCGGMPYLSISHYPDLNGKAVPGEPLELFVDGQKLKAKGVLFDSPLGHSVWRSLKEDKHKNPEEKIRISIGFLDLAHKHGDNGKVWVRESLHSICPECLHGVKNKVYVKGYLVHLALTRVPVNRRTEMVLEEKADMAKKTRKEDAESIVPPELVEEIETLARVSVGKSDAMVEMSEGENATVESTEAITDGKMLTEEDLLNAKKLEASTETPAVEKSEDDAMNKVVDEPIAVMENMPYGGATSMKDAEKHMAAMNEMMFVMDAWSVFSNVAWNIFQRDDVKNKKEMLSGAVDEFRNLLAAKAMVVFADLAPKEAVLSETQEHELKPAIDALLENIDNSLMLEADVNGKLASINPTLQELGGKILEYVTAKSQAVKNPVPEDKNKDTLLAELKSIVQPLQEAIANLQGEVGIIKSQANAARVETKPRIPQPKTFTSAVFKTVDADKPKPGSLRDIVNKSVGL